MQLYGQRMYSSGVVLFPGQPCIEGCPRKKTTTKINKIVLEPVSEVI